MGTTSQRRLQARSPGGRKERNLTSAPVTRAGRTRKAVAPIFRSPDSVQRPPARSRRGRPLAAGSARLLLTGAALVAGCWRIRVHRTCERGAGPPRPRHVRVRRRRATVLPGPSRRLRAAHHRRRSAGGRRWQRRRSDRRHRWRRYPGRHAGQRHAGRAAAGRHRSARRQCGRRGERRGQVGGATWVATPLSGTTAGTPLVVAGGGGGGGGAGAIAGYSGGNGGAGASGSGAHGTGPGSGAGGAANSATSSAKQAGGSAAAVTWGGGGGGGGGGFNNSGTAFGGLGGAAGTLGAGGGGGGGAGSDYLDPQHVLTSSGGTAPQGGDGRVVLTPSLLPTTPTVGSSVNPSVSARL